MSGMGRSVRDSRDRAPYAARQMRPAIRYLTTPDGVRLAYAVHGEGPPMVHVRGWKSHLDLFWDDMEFRAFFEAIGSRFQVIRFDMRGTGMSDRQVTDRLSLDELTHDPDAVSAHLPVLQEAASATCPRGPI